MGLIGELVVKITGDTAALNKSIDKSQKRLQKLSAGFVKAGKTLTKSLTLPIVALGAVSVRAFGKQAEAEAKLNAAIRATGKESEISAKNIGIFAAELQKTTLFGDEATISATALLQSFANLNEQGLKQIIPGILDMSAAMGISLETAATLVGKTLGSTTNALSRYGIVVDASADDININVDVNIADAKNIILDTITGTKIGTAITQLLGFYNATPVDQPDTVADAATQDLTGADSVDQTKLEADLTSCKNAINLIVDRLQELGLIA